VRAKDSGPGETKLGAKYALVVVVVVVVVDDVVVVVVLIS
jgi:hypothetical protein